MSPDRHGKAAFERTAQKPQALTVVDGDIPAELRQLPQWVCWQYVRKPSKNGSYYWSKLPCRCGGGAADSTDPATWSTYGDALSHLRASPCLDGIGFVFSVNDPFTGVDLDDALDAAGNVKPWARGLLDDLASYSEISPSHTGVKVYLRGQLPPASKHKKAYEDGEVEVYDQERFFAVTGHRLTEYPATVEQRQTQLNRLYQAIFIEPAKRRTGSPFIRYGGSSAADLDDQTLLQKMLASQSGDKLRRLWEGNCGDYGNDASRATAALCFELMWWTNRDKVRVDHLMRQSKLMRPKWDDRRGNSTWGAQEIDKAYAAVVGGYSGQQPNAATAASDNEGDPAAQEAAPVPPESACSYRFEVLNSADFAATDYRQSWLIKGLLARNLAIIVGGPRKCLKTSLLIDLVLSLGSGKNFLGQFEIPTSCRTVFLSAESGPWAIKDTALRISAAKGLTLADANVLWGFDLPQLANPVHLDVLKDGLISCEAEVVVMDPLYIALLSGALRGIEASNLFEMGPHLRNIAQTCAEAGCTPIFVHHSVKRLQTAGNPLDLEDLAFAGIQEFARQWLLLSRREPFDPGTPGSHRLWLNVGGSTGVAKLLGVNVEEGELRDDFSGRRWEVTVVKGAEARSQAKEEKNATKDEGKRCKTKEDGGALLVYLDKHEDGDGIVGWTRLRDGLGWDNNRMGRAIQPLLDDGIVEDCTWQVPNGKSQRKVRGIRRKRRGQAAATGG